MIVASILHYKLKKNKLFYVIHVHLYKLEIQVNIFLFCSCVFW